MEKIASPKGTHRSGTGNCEGNPQAWLLLVCITVPKILNTYAAEQSPLTRIARVRSIYPSSIVAESKTNLAINPPLGGKPMRLTHARPSANISAGSFRASPCQRLSSSLPHEIINAPTAKNAADLAKP